MLVKLRIQEWKFLIKQCLTYPMNNFFPMSKLPLTFIKGIENKLPDFRGRLNFIKFGTPAETREPKLVGPTLIVWRNRFLFFLRGPRYLGTFGKITQERKLIQAGIWREVQERF